MGVLWQRASATAEDVRLALAERHPMKESTVRTMLKRLEENGVKLHSALKLGFDRLYGYTSDAQGIRHALIEEPTIDFEDAKFMLVSCSAFVNLLRARSGESGGQARASD